MLLPGWFWGVLCVLGGLWYLAEPFFLFFQLLREVRETDPLLPLVEPSPPEDPAAP